MNWVLSFLPRLCWQSSRQPLSHSLRPRGESDGGKHKGTFSSSFQNRGEIWKLLLSDRVLISGPPPATRPVGTQAANGKRVVRVARKKAAHTSVFLPEVA